MSPRTAVTAVTADTVATPAGVSRRPAPRPAAPLPPARPARAAMFATVCTLLAVAGHVAAGREAVAPRAIVVGFAGLYLVAWILTGTERSLGTILGGLLGGQFMLHALFAAATETPAAAMGGAHAMAPGMAPGMASGAIQAAPAGAALGSDLTMTIAHVTAALVAAWWLRRGERAAWTLARRTAALAAYPLRALQTLVALIDAAPPYALVAPAGPYDSPRLIKPARMVLRGSVTRRGPPFSSTTCTCG